VFAGLVPSPVWVVIVALFALVSGAAITSPPATTLALADHPQIAGTASSLLGMVRFGLGGVAAPLVGIAGAAAILPLGIVTASAVFLAALASFVATRRRAQLSVPPAAELARIH
jgi:DHA1 family bicyclomycin/chloramphenicol resistance-like MFS transporter